MNCDIYSKFKGIFSVLFILLVILIPSIFAIFYVPETSDKLEIYDVKVTEGEGFFEDKVKIEIILINNDDKVYYADNISIKFTEGSFSSWNIDKSWKGKDIKPDEKASDTFNFDMTWGDDIEGNVHLNYKNKEIDEQKIGYDSWWDQNIFIIIGLVGIIVSIIVLIVVIRMYFYS